MQRFLERPGSRALLIAGEAGVGKTSLWRAAVGRAEAAGMRTIAARPAEAETSFAHAALGDLLGAHPEALDDLPAPQRRALEAALLVADAGAAPDQQAVALATLAALRALARAAPLVVAVDDVQWLDRPTAAVLAFAARRLADEPIALLLAQRTAGAAPAPLGLDRAADRLDRLDLTPLSLGAVQRLLQLRLGWVPSRPVLHHVHELSGGNPFFALELGRAVQAGTLRLQPGERLPVTLDALVEARLRDLPPATRRALAVAASMGQPGLAVVERGGGRRRVGGGRACPGRRRPRRRRALRPPAARLGRLRGHRSGDAACPARGDRRARHRAGGASAPPRARRDRSRRGRRRRARGRGAARRVARSPRGRGGPVRASGAPHAARPCRRGPAPDHRRGAARVPLRRQPARARDARRRAPRDRARSRARTRPRGAGARARPRRRPARLRVAAARGDRRSGGRRRAAGHRPQAARRHPLPPPRAAARGGRARNGRRGVRAGGERGRVAGVEAVGRGGARRPAGPGNAAARAGARRAVPPPARHGPAAVPGGMGVAVVGRAGSRAGGLRDAVRSRRPSWATRARSPTCWSWVRRSTACAATWRARSGMRTRASRWQSRRARRPSARTCSRCGRWPTRSRATSMPAASARGGRWRSPRGRTAAPQSTSRGRRSGCWSSRRAGRTRSCARWARWWTSCARRTSPSPARRASFPTTSRR